MKQFFFLLSSVLLLQLSASAQQQRWQQHVDYEMDIKMDVKKHQYEGRQKLVYTNNSPESLDKVFYHLFFNAFQPGSMMDVRSRTIADPDPRVGDRIAALSEEEQGWIKVKRLIMNGKEVSFETVGTILEVSLEQAIAPGEQVLFEMVWDAQVPLQIRRSGWNNAEGIEFSMTQWYPKMCEYDYEGWHANPYIGREFHGVWGDFKVNITLPSEYVIGGTGVLKNTQEIGHGYSDGPIEQKVGGEQTWQWVAENVHDFAWAADPDYQHKQLKSESGVTFHFLYQDDPEFNANWEELPRFVDQAFALLSEHCGEYPYPQYTIIQGGDGGMEYPMATLITGKRNLRSLVGVSVHEAAHSWYQGVLATNESLYEWMDEGFTSYATSIVMNELFEGGLGPHHYAYQGYYRLVADGSENPLITHADHYQTNRAYGTAAYSKGEVLLAQLGYIIGAEARDAGILSYYDSWKYKHPNPTDFKRVMEMQSGIELDWYFQYFMNTTLTIDYGIKGISGGKKNTSLILERVGDMPMPVDVLVELKNGESHFYSIPLRMMRGSKDFSAYEYTSSTLAADWPWTHPEYELELPFAVEDIASVQIDPSALMADIDQSNNFFELIEGVRYFIRP